MKVYVASSWRNDRQPNVVKTLREAGHEVYDFRNPREGNCGFHWSDIDPEWKSWTPERYRECLSHDIAEAGFNSDMDALRDCDAVVAVQPFGRSASLELGRACGAGKLTLLFLADGEPELMVKMCSAACVDMGEVLNVLANGKPAAMPERRPQRFRYRTHGSTVWEFGAVFPAGQRLWTIRADNGFASFHLDPWEVMGLVIGDVAEFRWIDNDFGWSG